MDCNACKGSGLSGDLACRACAGTGRVRNTVTRADSIKTLRKSIRRAKGPEDTFVDGDVIKWQRGQYTYVALRAGGSWWITGRANYGLGPICTYQELSKILALPSTTDIRVASAWSAV